MRLISLLILSIVAAPVAAAQTHTLLFRGGALKAQVAFETAPQVGRDSPILIQFLEGSSPTAISDQMKVVLWMPSMGHGSSPTKVEKVVENGREIPDRYRVSRVYFSMGGVWEVRVQLKGSVTETQAFTLEL